MLTPAFAPSKGRFSLRSLLFSVSGTSSAPVAALGLGIARSPANARLFSSLTTEYCEHFLDDFTHRSNCTRNYLLNGYLFGKPFAASSEAASIAATESERCLPFLVVLLRRFFGSGLHCGLTEDPGLWVWLP
jgi:hypothetical protein